MEVVAFHGSPRKGNTYTATKLFMDALSQWGEVRNVRSRKKGLGKPPEASTI